jgi:murein DD-endopeptidase MepM/ murein hydrolase activator NlpD
MIADDTQPYHDIAHPNGPPVVASGMRVQAGQVLGYLGQSGRSRGNPHLHDQVSIRSAAGAVQAFLNPFFALRRLSLPGAIVARTNTRVRRPLSGCGAD